MTPTMPQPTRNIRQRVLSVLKGEKPDRLPFVDRLELWYASHTLHGTVPEDYRGLSLTDLHRATGLGQQKFVPLHAIKLRGVELVLTRDGDEIYHEIDPVVDYFPRLYGTVPYDTPGVVVAQIRTPRGTLTTRQQLLPNMVEAGMGPYMSEHAVKSAADLPAVEYILDRAEFILREDRVREQEALIGESGYVVPAINRIPFQQVMLDYVGEMPLFYMLHDEPDLVRRLIALVAGRLGEVIDSLATSALPYVEFVDNVEAHMTNPRLFAEFCLGDYQRYVEMLHRQGKKLGSHTDGNIKPLLRLLAETGLDVCESISPAPLTQCTFDEAWNTWQALDGPIIWGGIPSVILEPETSEADFRAYIEHVLELVGDKAIILGIGDMVVPVNLIERVHYIAERVEAHVI